MINYTVYADILFFINFFLDAVLLLGTAHFGGFKFRYYRIFLASLIGGVYGTLFLFPNFSYLYTITFKILTSLIILFIAFGRLKWRKFLRLITYFYGVSFAMAGAVIGLSSLISQTSFSTAFDDEVSLGALFFALISAIILGRYGIVNIKEHLQKQELNQEIEVIINKKSCKFQVLLDTGNNLRDPITGRGVMVAEFNAINNILPPAFNEIFLRFGENDVVNIFDYLPKNMTKRLRLIPFNAIGKENGMLLGIVTDYIILNDGQERLTRENRVIKNMVVCLYPRKIINNDGYRGIVNPINFKIEEE